MVPYGCRWQNFICHHGRVTCFSIWALLYLVYFPLWLLLAFFSFFTVLNKLTFCFLFVSYIGFFLTLIFVFIVLAKFGNFCHYFFKGTVVFFLSSSSMTPIACRLVIQTFFHLPKIFFSILVILSLYCHAFKLSNVFYV